MHRNLEGPKKAWQSSNNHLEKGRRFLSVQLITPRASLCSLKALKTLHLLSAEPTALRPLHPKPLSSFMILRWSSQSLPVPPSPSPGTPGSTRRPWYSCRVGSGPGFGVKNVAFGDQVLWFRFQCAECSLQAWVSGLRFAGPGCINIAMRVARVYTLILIPGLKGGKSVLCRG